MDFLRKCSNKCSGTYPAEKTSIKLAARGKPSTWFRGRGFAEKVKLVYRSQRACHIKREASWRHAGCPDAAKGAPLTIYAQLIHKLSTAYKQPPKLAPSCGPWSPCVASKTHFLEPLVVRAGSAIERYTKQKPNIENGTAGLWADLHNVARSYI